MKVNLELEDHDIDQFLDRMRQLDELVDSLEELKDLIIETRRLVDKNARKN